ncbi:twitchin isoform X5 [Anopheles funestus]|uniref:twitchin isoform X5 n=1 Tax=Anopheles funestus TaxID=62324 RepID=UPI0020C67FDB|nr:twitchin isoform X5 [Anopheles funestus]
MADHDFAPSFTQKPQLRQEDDGNRLIFECQLVAKPKPSIEWYRSEELLSENTRTKFKIQSFGENKYFVVLELDDVIDTDAGLYKVKAKNRMGEVSASINLNFSPADEPVEKQIDGVAPTFIKKPSIKQENDGKRLIFECEIKADPKPQIRWSHNSKVIDNTPRHKFKVQNDGTMYRATLEVDNVSFEDSGKYKVTAKNELGESSATISLNFDTNENERGFAPSFVEKPKIIPNKLGTLITMKCRCRSKPKPTVKWMRKKQEVTSSNKVALEVKTVDEDTYELTLNIKDPNADDGGSYSCIISNEFGESSATLNLNIEAEQETTKNAPIFVEKPHIVSLDNGKLVRMECKVKTDIKPDITWTREGRLLQETSKLKMTMTQEKDVYHITLVLKDPQTEDSGTYKCNIKNILGELNANLILNIEIIPVIKEKPKLVTNVKKRTASIECSVASRFKPECVWMKETTVIKETHRHMIKIEETREGEFSVKLNIVGLSEADFGAYKLVAKNDKGQATSQVIEIKDIVFEKPPATKPIIDAKFKDVEIDEGGDLTLAAGLAQPDRHFKVYWMKNKTILKASETVIQEFTGRMAKLVVKNVTVEDAGSYKVSISNETQSDECECKVKVNAKPKPKDEEKPKKKPAKKVEEEEKQEEKVELKKVAKKETDEKAEEEKVKLKKVEKQDLEKQAEEDKLKLKKVEKKETELKVEEQKVQLKKVEKKDGELKVEEKKAELKKVERKEVELKVEGEKVELKKVERRASEAKVEEKKVELKKVEQPDKIEIKVEEAKKVETKKEEKIQIKVEEDRRGSIPKIKEEPAPAQKGLEAPSIEIIRDKGSRRGSFMDDRRPSLLINDDTKLRPGEVIDERKKRRPSIDVRRPSIQDMDEKINQPSTPLRAIGEDGKAAIIVDFQESYSAVEDQTGYISVQVEGNPAPTWKFFKGITELVDGGRYKHHTDGESNTITLCIRKVKPNDEGKYKVVVSNAHGEDSADVQLYVSDASGMDFRAMLKKRKYAKWGKEEKDPDWGDLKEVEKPKPQLKKVERKQDTFSKPLVDITCKEGKEKKVVFEATFTKPNAKAKWLFRKDEIFTGSKYKFKAEGDNYTCTIFNPKVEDGGKYTLEIAGISCFAYLNVEEADPVYKFTKNLKKAEKGFLTHDCTLECAVDNSLAPIGWYKGETKLENNDKYVIGKDLNGTVTLIIKNCTADDADTYRCQIEKQTDKTETKLKILEYNYKFTKVLKSQQLFVKDTVTMACELDHVLGKVEWFKGDEKIVESDKVQIVKDGRKHKLILKDAAKTDSGVYRCVSNADKTEAEIFVKRPNKFMKKLSDTVGNETEKLVLEIQVQDEEADVAFFLGDTELKKDGRVDIINNGDGTHKLVFNKLELTDAGEIRCECGPLTSKCTLKINKKETKPKFEVPPKVETPAKVEKVLEVPFTTGESRQSKVVAKLYKDGKPVPPEDVDIVVENDKVVLKFKKTEFKDSGEYKIELTNATGTEEHTTNVVFQDKPQPPQDLGCIGIYQTKCVVKWKAPENDGGAPLEKYVVERQDVFKRSGWDVIGESPGDQCKFNCNDLVSGRHYKFRVKAVNKMGESEYCAMENDIIAKDPWTEPDPPRDLNIADWDKDFVDLRWKVPKSDGGAPITSYMVEYKPYTAANWKHYADVGAAELNLTIRGLTVGETFEFRVKAVNQGGASKPSNSTEPLKIRDRYVKPFIEGEGLQPITLKKGQTVRYYVQYGGEPEPEVVWEKDDILVICDSEKRKTIDVESYATTIQVRHAVRSDSGDYKLRLKNSSGEFVTIGKVLVLDVPTQPIGPIKIEKARSNHVVISWQPPEDTGGCPLTGYLLEKMDVENGTWLQAGECGADQTTFDFTHLQKGRKFEFRVKAYNKEGESTPLETLLAVKTVNPYDPPEAPGKPIVDDYGVDFVELKWEKPEKDGGRPITHYVIECKNKFLTDWTECAKTENDDCVGKVHGLKEKVVYQFRVRAVNKGGASKASEPSDNHTVKHKNLKPRIDRTNLKNITIKVGKSMIWSVDVKGEPEPEIIWTWRDDIPLTNTENIKIENANYHSNFSIKDAKRADTGKYKIVAQNVNGKDEETVELVVLGSPGRPQGKLEVSNVTKKGLKLKWKKPADDGGSPILEYKIEKLKNRNGKWVRCGTVTGGPEILEADITGLDEGATYKFRVIGVNAEGDGEPLESEEVVAKNPYDEPWKPGTPEIVDYDDKSVKLKWAAPKSDGGAPIQKYVIQKKDRFKDWEDVSEVDGGETTATIEDLKENTECQFRIVAVNKAGRSPESDPTKSHIVKHRALKPRIDRTNLKPIVIRAGKMVHYDVNVKGEPEPEITWIVKEKPVLADDNYEIINKDYNTKFTLKDSLRKHSGVYKIQAKNEHGQDEAEVEITILSSPSRPKGPLEVKDVTKNGCKLKWKKPDDDGGKPITGYELQKYDQKVGRWVPIGKAPADAEEFDVTGLQEGQHYKFRVKAINDEGESEPLETEEYIVAKNPFDVPKAPTDVVIVDWDNQSATLEWKRPNSDGGAAITGYFIEKKEKGESKWEPAITTSSPECRAKVVDLPEKRVYQFRVSAINKAGTGEASDPTNFHTVKHRYLRPRIDRTNLNPITIKAGLSVQYDIDIEGEPAPTVKWFHGEKELATDADYKIDNVDYNTKFFIMRGRRNLTGKYTIVATNSQGEDRAEVEICILSKPGTPEGPLEASDIHKHGCKLKWKAPLDDGGMPIEGYEIEKLDPLTGQWIPCGQSTTPEANISGLQEGKQYKFRVKAFNKEGDSEPLEMETVIIAKDPYSVPSKPGRPKPTNWSKDFVELEWTTPKSDGGAPITEYIIQKRDKASRKWQDAATVKGDRTKGTVEDVEEGHEYEFRVVAVNRAGQSEPSDISDSVIAKMRFLAPKIDRKNLDKKVLRSGQLLNVEADVTGEPAPKVTWEFKGKLVDGKEDDRIKLDNEEYKTNLVIRNLKRSDAGIYKITAKNDSGTDTVDLELVVLAKPSKCLGPLKVTDVTADGCKLNWLPPEDDGGEPIQAYIVERMDVDNGRWIQVCETRFPEADVTGLQEGKEYMLRVKAVNSEGESEPLETDTSIKAKNPYDAPSAPGKPKATDWSRKFVMLEWKEPESDGNAPIQKYIIEKKDVNSTKWQKAMETDGPETKAKVPDLFEGTTYQFRVKAVNKGGHSPYSPLSDPVTVKDRFAPPRIDRSTLKNITLKGGQSLRLDCKISGEPAPTKYWLLNKARVEKDTPDVRVEFEDYRAKLSISNITRAHGGSYEIKAENASGYDEAQITVTVLDKPTAPEGPLKVSNVHKEGCSLKWNPPLDDGGVPIEYYNVEKFDKETQRWLPVGRTHDTHMDVANLEPGQEYLFRVSAVNDEGVSEPLATDTYITAKNPFDEPGKPGTPEAYDWDKNFIELRWTPPMTDGGSPITKYIVEKRVHGTIKWIKCAEVLGNKCEAKVTELNEGEVYEFKVRAVNEAGPGIWSDHSKPITAKPRKLPPKIDRRNLKNLSIAIGEPFGFDVKISGEPAPDVDWTINDRMVTVTTTRTIDNVPYNSKFANQNPDRRDSGKYMIKATNKFGSDQVEITVTVRSKPAAPEGPLEVKDMTKDSCKLEWKKPKDDGGVPIDHYVIEKFDPDNGIWMNAGKTDGPITEFPVEGLVPGHRYKFRVKAVNPEGESEPLETAGTVVAKDSFSVPDTPSAPTVVDWSENHAVLKWPEPDDGGSPITGYIIEKKDKYSPIWEKAIETNSPNPTATVGGLVEGNEYQFRVIAINKAGPSDPSDSSRTFTAKPRFAPPKIDRRTIRDLSISAGSMLKFDVAISGEPAPKCEWRVNKAIVTGGDRRLEILNTDYNSKFILRPANRGDSGDYEITATNSSGRDHVLVQVTVTDKPGPPEGPLTASDITKETCKLKWKRPKDDGGCDIEYYQIERFDDDVKAWVPHARSVETNADINGLQDGKKYKFRVSAINAEGESKPLEMAGDFIAKNPFDEPSAPRDCKATDWGTDFVKLAWQPPVSDGGSPITGYVVEVKDKYGEWERKMTVPAEATSANVPDLLEGQKYEFRVRAVNDAGPSDPSNATPPIICKPRNQPPKIDRTNLVEVRIKAGNNVVYDVKVSGEPVPTTRWSISKREIKPTDRYKLQNYDYSTKLTIRSATREESGTYQLDAENENGKDTATVQVTVLDVPSPPGGPLKVVEITANTAVLEWRPPSDDGGLPIDNYIIEKLDEVKGTWVYAGDSGSPRCKAEIDGLIEGHTYKFRVRAANKMGKSEPLSMSNSVLAKNPYRAPDRPEQVEIKDYDKDYVELEWKAPENDGGSPITGYVVEKLGKYSSDWEKAAEVPEGDITSVKVPDLIEGTAYQFRVRAINRAGEGDPSRPTESHIARSKNQPPKIDRNYLSNVKIRAGLTFEFDVPVSGEPVPAKEWSHKDNMIINTDRIKVVYENYRTKLRVIDVKRADSGVYTLTAKNKNGIDIANVNVTILDVPAPPEGPIRHENLSKTGVTLMWRPPKDDGGSEILHYVVEKLDTDQLRWVPVGETISTKIRPDNLIEGHSYQFRVRAVNKQGESTPLVTSQPITAKDPYNKPDKPGKPLVVDWSDDHVDLEWTIPKKDGGAPITSYIVEKRPRYGDWKFAGEFTELYKPSAKIKELTKDEEYEFRVCAVNKAGVSDPSEPSDPVVCKSRFVSPHFNKNALKDLVVPVGKKIAYNISVEASPQVTAVWKRNGAVIPESQRVIREVYNNEVSLEIPFSIRDDSGMYTLIVKNECGEFSASANVTVLDKPAPPEGPLRITNITTEGCRLEWKLPKDDGGSPITHYVIEKMDMSRGTWTNAGMSTSLVNEISRLIHNKRYSFRVKAVNEIGESEPLDCSHPIIAKNDYEEPSQPPKPEVRDWDANSVTIQWNPPKSDGGATITEYIIQKKEKDSPYWSNAGRVPGIKRDLQIPDLATETEYEFRVIAVNAAGESEPSDPTDAVLTRSRFIAPKIVTPMRDMVVKAGLIFHLDINFTGEPVPEVEWTLNGKPVKTDSRTTMTALGHHTIVHTVNCNRGDSGTYKLVITNSSGTDEGSFNLTVLDRPDPPQGPMVYEEITEKSVTISWKPPLDNGGSELTGYVVEKKDLTHGGGWVPAVAYVSPKYTHTVVPRLNKGNKYEFRVMAENLQGRSDGLMSAHPVVAKDQFVVPGPPTKPDIIDSGYDQITLSWKPPISDGGSRISGYIIERRDLATGRWIQANKYPVPNIEYTDTGVIKGHQYEYRVSAVNQAGQGNPSDSSVKCWARPMQQAPALNMDSFSKRTIKVRAGEPIVITIPLVGAPLPTVEWSRGGNKIPETSRVSIDTNMEQTVFRVDNSNRNDSGTYKIKASNQYGEDVKEFEVIVVDRPQPPKYVSGLETTQDSVTLNWDPPSDDGGSEITGYSIEYKEFPSDNWKMVFGTVPRCSHTIKHLTENHEYVFRVRAENIYGASEPTESKPISPKSPDPPEAVDKPTVTDYTPSACTIAWKPPRVQTRPVVGYFVEKRERGTGEWVQVNNYPTTNTTYTIPDLMEGFRYEFRVKTVNEVGVSKPSEPTDPITASHQRKRPNQPDPPSIDKITRNSVNLSWRTLRRDAKERIKGYIVQYRVKDDEKWLDANSPTDLIADQAYRVENLEEGKEYQFRLIAVNEIGMSDPSRPSISVTLAEQPNKPMMDLSNVRDITVRAGEDFNIHVPYTAFPKPVSTWFVNEELLDDRDKRFHTQLTDEAASIVVVKSVRADTKQYRLMLKNPSGYDIATCNVKVLDRPSKPENIGVESYGGEHLVLCWNAPQDDGGSPVTNYVVEKKDKNSNAWTKVSSYCTTNYLKIRNLRLNQLYDFRVYAENKYGLSEPAQADSIVAKHPFDPPSQPGTPSRVETTEDTITITWTKPASNGGSPVTHYIVEKKLATEGHWSKVQQGTLKDLMCKITGLSENHEYVFRVAAVNAAGTSPYSNPSDPIMVSAAFTAPKITSDIGMRDILVIARDPFKIIVPYTATPKPDAIWMVNGNEVSRNERIELPINDTEAIFKNDNSKRIDSGSYTIHLVNCVGKDTASCRVLVVDKPSPPIGPLEVSEITPESCTLSWKTPLDDGGSPITNYIVERYEPLGYWTKASSFVRSTHYDNMGMEANKPYNFRVRAENQYGVSDPLILEEPIIARYPFTVPDPPNPPRVSDWDANYVTVTWERPLMDGGSRIQGYRFEYRDVLDSTWITNNFLIKDNSYQVYNLLPGREYEFRVRAQNAAGVSKPSASSKKFKIHGKITPPSAPGAPAVVKVGKSFVDLSWTPPATDGGSRILGYYVERRDIGGARWVKCNENNIPVTELTVTNLIEGGVYEFRVYAVNNYGVSPPSPETRSVRIGEQLDTEKPEWVKRLKFNLVPLGKSVELTCEAHGKPEPTCRWLRNGKEITHGGQYALESKNGVFSLHISNVTYRDEGDYTCEALNFVGVIHTTGALKIGVPPKLVNIPSDVYLVKGDNAKIKLCFHGDQPMEVNISKDREKLIETEHIKYTVFDDYAVIYIRDVLDTDKGVYLVNFKNDSGSVSCNVNVHVTGLPGPPTGPLLVSHVTKNMCTVSWKPPAYDGGRKVTHYIVERRDIKSQHWLIVSNYVKESQLIIKGLIEGSEYLFRVSAVNENGIGPALEGVDPIKARGPYDLPSAPGVPIIHEVGGDFVNLEWEKPVSDGGARIQGYWIEKREQDTDTWQRVNTTLCVICTINCANLVEGRHYEFRVAAQNEIGVSEFSKASQLVKVVDPDVVKPPEVVKPLNTLTCVQNRGVEFVCKITGVPRPRITWHKGAREICSGSRYHMYSDGDTHHLAINDVFGEDADEYTCRAANRGGVRSTKASLIIKSPPKLNVPPRFRDTAFFDNGENIEIKIPFTGFPKPRCHWTLKGEQIESGSHYHIETRERHTVLTIRDGSQLDSGTYTITIENELGQDTADIKIQISDRPDKPRNLTIDQIGLDHVTLSWLPPSWDGGASITNYIVEKREVPLSTWIRAGTTRFNQLIIPHLSPGHQYEFRVFAENVYGRSEPSDQTELISLKDLGIKPAKRVKYELDENGKPKRQGKKEAISDYDDYVFDVYSKYHPKPVEISNKSVYDQYEILEEIGTGAFGVVHRCRERKTGNVFAAKFIPVSTNAERELIRREIDIMNQLHHRKLIYLHDAFEDEDEMVLIYEFLSGGELFERITTEGYRMCEQEIIEYMKQICEAVKYMHERNIIHLDIKPENVMCQTRNTNQVKLIDFGLATKLNPNEMVKISTGTAEFAAPEIVEREPVGFYTDMWAVGVLAYVLVSGLSPFAGETDIDTLKNIKQGTWEFDEVAFRDVSEECKDFIRRLLIKNTEKRMTAHECLMHVWLSDTYNSSTSVISIERYKQIRDLIRRKYENWASFVLPLGRLSEYSALRKLLIQKYKIHETSVDRRQAAPRFVIRPQSAFCYEGQSCKFYCRVIGVATPVLTWYHNNQELKQSVKFMKRYAGDDYYFIINRVKLDDRGEYIIRAENHYGAREEVIFLNVHPMSKQVPIYKPETLTIRKREPSPRPFWQEEADSAPSFTFALRPRVMQLRDTCKLLCCVTGKPMPSVKWYKNGRELSKYEYTMTHTDGVVTMEIIDTKVEDSGEYKCVAVNPLGKAETTCVVIVEDHRAEQQLAAKPDVKKPTIKKPEPAKTASSGARLGAPTNEARSRNSTRELIPLQSDSLMHPPEFTKQLKDVVAADGEPLQLNCHVNGDPLPQIVWTRDGKKLSSSDVIDIKYKSGIASLRINELFPEDSGVYVCTAKNSMGEAFTQCTLDVKKGPTSTSRPEGKGIPIKPPVIKKHADSGYYKDGSEVFISCSINCTDPFNVIWLHDNREIKNSADFEYLNDGDIHTLHIAEIFPEDAGTYTCEAFNKGGESFSSCTITVLAQDDQKDKPTFAKFPASLSVLDGAKAVFSCETFEAPSKLQWYKDGEPINESSNRYRFVKKDNKYTFTVAKCSFEDIGQYQVRVVTRTGDALASFSLNVSA